MKTFFVTILLFSSLAITGHAAPNAGFALPDSIEELTLRYKTINNLIVLPVTINDSIEVNLILDTGCRNMILFGKEFASQFQTQEKEIQFSGLGSGKHISGKLALNNTVSIDAIEGQRIPVIIVPQKNLFSAFKNIHGVIGYEIFIKFEIEINFPKQLITFRPASSAFQRGGMSYVPMKIVDSRPLIGGKITLHEKYIEVNEMVIDTGSSLGLIIGVGKESKNEFKVIGRGLNGKVEGVEVLAKKLQLHDIEMRNISASLIFQRENYASMGMEILKNYTIILNYPKAYVGFSIRS